jgi:hypothetical protein
MSGRMLRRYHDLTVDFSNPRGSVAALRAGPGAAEGHLPLRLLKVIDAKVPPLRCSSAPCHSVSPRMSTPAASRRGVSGSRSPSSPRVPSQAGSAYAAVRHPPDQLGPHLKSPQRCARRLRLGRRRCVYRRGEPRIGPRRPGHVGRPPPSPSGRAAGESTSPSADHAYRGGRPSPLRLRRRRRRVPVMGPTATR